MFTIALLAFLHHIAAFVLFGVLMIELVLLKSELTLGNARSLLRMDALYGMAATVLLIVGFLRVFYTEKGHLYYFQNMFFIAKLSLFIIVGFLSIYPTIQFLGWRKALKAQQLPVLDDRKRRSLRNVIHLELTLIAGIILCAVLMARGVGVAV